MPSSPKAASKNKQRTVKLAISGAALLVVVLLVLVVLANRTPSPASSSASTVASSTSAAASNSASTQATISSITTTSQSSNTVTLASSTTTTSSSTSATYAVATVPPPPPPVATVQITVTSNPSGYDIVGYQSGVGYAAISGSETFTWQVGSTHSLVANYQSLPCGTASTPPAAGCYYVFTSWSGGQSSGPINTYDTITVPNHPATYVASYQTYYLLTINNNPSGAGYVNTPPGSPPPGWLAPVYGPEYFWYAAGQTITIKAAASNGYAFNSWAGSYSGKNEALTVTMNSAVTETANYRTT